jgi:hypothetical protein
MLTTLLLFGLTLQQQPRARAPQTGGHTAAFDSTGVAVNALGVRVADVRSALEEFRRAVFNGPDGEVLRTAGQFRAACHALDSVASRTARRVCRRCASSNVQQALDRYREAIPSVTRVGARCAAQLSRLVRGPDAAKRLRRDVRVIGNPIVTGLVPYERRLETLLAALRGRTVPPGGAPRGGGATRRPS